MRAALDRLYDAAACAGGVVHGRHAGRWCVLGIAGRLLDFNLPGTDAYAGYCMAARRLPRARAHAEARRAHPRHADPRAPRRPRRARALELWALAVAARARGAVRVLQRAPRVAVVRLQRHLAPATTRRRCGSRRSRWRSARVVLADRDASTSSCSSGAARARASAPAETLQQSSSDGRARHRAAHRRAVRAARQRRVDRPRAGGRRVDRHGALLVAAGRRRDGGDDLGHRRRRGRSPRCRCSCGWARSCSARGCPRTCSRASRRGSSACPGGCCTPTSSAARSSPRCRARRAATCATIGKMTLPELKRARLSRGHHHRHARRRRHAGPADPAVDHHDRLRRDGERVDRAAVHRRRDPRHPAGGALLGLHRRVGAAASRTQSRPPTERTTFAQKLYASRHLIPVVLLIVAGAGLDLRRRRDGDRSRGVRRRRLARRSRRCRARSTATTFSDEPAWARRACTA